MISAIVVLLPKIFFKQKEFLSFPNENLSRLEVNELIYKLQSLKAGPNDFMPGSTCPNS